MKWLGGSWVPKTVSVHDWVSWRPSLKAPGRRDCAVWGGSQQKGPSGTEHAWRGGEEHPAGWGDLGGGCRTGRAPEESERMGQQEGGSGGLPAGELEEEGLAFLHARMAVNFACLRKRSNIGRQGGCFRLVGEAGGTKGKEETGGEEYRGPRRPAGKVLPWPKCDESQAWLKLLVWEFLCLLSPCEPCGEGQCRRKAAPYSRQVFTEHLLCAAAVLGPPLGPLPSAVLNMDCIPLVAGSVWEEAQCESTGLKFPFLFIFVFCEGLYLTRILCILLCLSYSLLHQSVTSVKWISHINLLVQFKKKQNTKTWCVSRH